VKIRRKQDNLQEVTKREPSNMAVTNAEDQALSFKKNLKKIYKISQSEPKSCLVKDLFSPTSDKWSLFCLYYLGAEKNLRFNTLKKRIPGISARMLSTTLKKLESIKLLKREAFAEVPPRVEYSLTKFGYAYTEKLLELNLWLYEKHGK